MPQSLKEIEEFFSASFALASPGSARELHYFDGYAHWCVLHHDSHCLFITADRDLGVTAFPIVELTAYCSRISASHASGVGPVLILHPDSSESAIDCVTLTKTEAGRISLSISVGARTNRRKAEPDGAGNSHCTGH